MPAFDVTTNPTKLDPLKPGGKATIVVTATNQLPRAVTARAQKVVDPATYDGMVKPPPGPQRTFSQKGATQDFPFTIEVPADAKAGSFTTRFDVVDVANPDDNFGQSSGLKVTIEVPPPPPPPNGKKKPWWFWVLIGVGVVVVVAVVLWILLKPKGGMPDVTNLTYDSAQSLLAGDNVRAVRKDTLDRDTSAWKGNIVIRQRPKGGSKLNTDSTSDTLVVQVPFTVVPGLSGQQPDVAANKLGLAGLNSNGVERCTTNSALNELVMLLSPGEGTLVARNSTVVVYVGTFRASCLGLRDRGIRLERMSPLRVAPSPVPRDE